MDGEITRDQGAGGGVSWGNYQTDAGGSDTVSASGSDALKGVNQQSVISRSDGTTTIRGQAAPGSTEPGDVALPVPADVDPALANEALTILFDPKALERRLETGADSFLAAISEQDRAEAEKIVVTDPEILRLAKEKGIPPGVLQKAINNMASQNLTIALGLLPPDVSNKLMLALAYPGAVNLPPELSALLQMIKTAVQSTVSEQFGIPTNWPGQVLNTGELQENLTIQFDRAFKDALQEAIDTASPPLTEAQIKQLKALHYIPTAVASGVDPALLEILKSVEGRAKAQLQQKYGLDTSWTPPADNAYFSSILNGTFINEFKKLAENFTPPLSKDDALNVQRYAGKFFANRFDTDIPGPVKELLTKLVEGATKAVIAQYGLSSTQWRPAVTTLTPPGLDLSTFTVMQSALSQLQERYEFAKLQLDKMPPGPEKMAMTNYLLAMSKALNELQDAINAMTSSQIQTSKIMSRLNFAIQQENIDAQRRQQDAVQQEESKLEEIIPISNFMDVVTKIGIVALGCCAGPVGLAMAIAYVSKDGVFDPVFAKVQSGCVEFGKAIGGPAGEQFGEILGGTTCLVVAMWFSCGNANLASEMMFKDAKAVETYAKVGGANENQQKIAAAVAAGVAQMATAIAMSAMSGGAGSGAALASVMNALKMTEKSMKIATTVARLVMVAFQLTTTGINAYNQGIEINNAQVRAEITRLRAQFDVKNEEVQAFLTIVKKLITELQAALQGNTSWVLDISNLQASKWSQASQISSEIWLG